MPKHKESTKIPNKKTAQCKQPPNPAKPKDNKPILAANGDAQANPTNP